MRTKLGVDTLNFDDLYNNLRVFESDVKVSTRSSSSTQNVAFVSSNNTSSTNEVNTAYGVSTSFGHNSQKEGSSSYTDDLIYSFFANQSSIDWTGQAEDDTKDYALMAFNSSNSSSDTELNADINWDAVIEQVKRNERLNDVVMKYQTLKRKPLTQAKAKRNMIVYLKNMAGFKMDYFKGMTYDKIRPLFEKHYNYNQIFLNEVNEGVKVSETELRQEKDVEVESSKREGKSLEQKIAKKQKMEKETEELKKHLHIETDDDDVYTDVTPLASKIPIVDYKIHTERNKPCFKIIRADGNHMIYPSTHFTLEKMLDDVRLQVKDESEMSLELLRLVRRQLNEGDMGCHIDGFIAVVAHTIVLQQGCPVTGRTVDIIDAVNTTAAEVALRIVIPRNMKPYGRLMLHMIDEAFLQTRGLILLVKDIKEKDKIKAQTEQNQEQTESVEKSKVKPDIVKA
nr:hypothetical protein [Tanacetum cinerariifolium]